MTAEPTTERELNRALLARQGLWQRLAAPPGEVVESVGALQMQYWPALRPALWSRIAECSREAIQHALTGGDLLTGTLLRATIHTVTARQYPEYAAVTVASKLSPWRTKDIPSPEAAAELREALREYAAAPRTLEQLAGFLDAWADRHPRAIPEAEVAYQSQYKWRPFCTTAGLLRVPADGQWSTKTPNAFQTAPIARSPSPEQALDTVIRAHLRAFGPAAAEDVASWIFWNITPVREALRTMTDLVTFTDEAGRTLYDLPDAPRPDPDSEVPVRLLPWFDSVLLAYAPKRRTRILPEAYRDIVYVKANGQLKPTFLVDGWVAGMWAVGSQQRVATLTLTPLRPLDQPTRKALVAEAEQLIEFLQPEARSHTVAWAD